MSSGSTRLSSLNDTIHLNIPIIHLKVSLWWSHLVLMQKPLVWTQAHSTWQYPFSLKVCYSCTSGVAMGSNILFDENPPSSPGCTGSWSVTVDGVTAETAINNLRDWNFKPSLQLQSASEHQHCTFWLSPSIFSLLNKTSGNNSSMRLYKGVIARGAMTVNSPTTLESFSWITH